MIYQLFISLFIVAFLFLFYGWYSRTDMPRLIGFFLIFLLGGMLEPALPGSVEYFSGLNTSEYYVYGDNYTGYHWDYMNDPPECLPNNLDCVKLFHTETIQSEVYSVYESHTIGFFLSIAGILGFVLVMVDRRKAEVEN
jgi:hypothetical protein